MLKRLAVAVLLLCFSYSSVFAVIGVNQIQPEEASQIQSDDTRREFIISFKEGASPDELQEILQQHQAQENTIFGFIYNGILKIAGKKTEAQKTEEKIAKIKSVYEELHVTHAKKLDTIESISPNTYAITIADQAPTDEVINKLQTIPEVKSVIPNFMLRTQPATGSSIQSTEEIPKTIQFVVKYKQGQAPQQIQDEVNKTSSSLIGTFTRIAAETIGRTNQNNPKKKLDRIRSSWQKLGYEYSQYIYSPEAEELHESTQVITFQNDIPPEQIINEYKNLPEVEVITPSTMAFVDVVPNDPDYSQLWAMPKIQAPVAWDKATGSNSVIVAVIDSGIDYNHPDLAGRIIKGKDFATCNDTAQETAAAPPGGCLNPKLPDDDPMDDMGHGTHVAGTVGAVGNNNIGVTGVNWDVKIMAIKVIGTGGGGPFPAVLQGIQYAADNGADVINMSLGMHNAGNCTSPSAAIANDAVNYAKSKGSLVVVAAGNDNTPVTNDIFGSCPAAFVVGATTQTDSRANFSNYGSNVAIAAPGVGILSTKSSVFNIPPQGCQVSGQYAACSGTSMATPHVAGAAALLLSINSSLTPDQVRNYLISSADPITTDRPIGPRLNLAKAVDLVAGPDGVTTTPSNSPTPTSTTGVTPSPVPNTSPTPTGTNPSPTGVTPTPQGPSPSPLPTNGEITISVRLPGIGSGGSDNNNPTRPSRQAAVILTDLESERNIQGNLTYANGVYSGTIPAPAGTYQISVKLDNTLTKRVPGLYRISSSQRPTAQTVTLVPGDINQDGILDIFDYNIMIQCVTTGCGNNSARADLNDDGVANPADLNILLRQFAQRQGD